MNSNPLGSGIQPLLNKSLDLMDQIKDINQT